MVGRPLTGLLGKRPGAVESDACGYDTGLVKLQVLEDGLAAGIATLGAHQPESHFIVGSHSPLVDMRTTS